MKNLKKINIFIFVFLVLFNLKSYAEVVNKIIVNGNERISSETVVIFGDILIGKKVGEGLFGISFKIKGLPDNLKTTVNPVKTLTPRFITRALEASKKKNSKQ